MLSFAPLILHFQRIINYPEPLLLLTPSILTMNTLNTSSPTEAAQQPTHQAVASVAATSLPEIASLIALTFSKEDIAACALVCRAWSSVYTPLLWKDIRARIPNPLNASLLPTLLATHGAFIRTLSINDAPEHFLSRADPSTDLVFDCATIENVVHLTISTENDKKKAFRNIIHRNRHTLRFLWLTFHVEKPKQAPDWCGEPLFDFPGINGAPCLQSLYLERWRMTRRELILILKACPVLKLLSFSDIYIVRDDNNINCCSSSGSSQEPTGSNVLDIEPFQHLALVNLRMCSKLYPILDLIPNVKTIEFYRFDRSIDPLELKLFCESIRAYCPKLQQVWAFGFECSMLPAIVDSIEQLVTFRGSSNMATVLSILDHANTLEEANLSDYTEQTFLPLRFLETCPRLKQFMTGHSSTTIAEVRGSLQKGWACRDLRELRLSIYKLSPALIGAIMQDLGAEKETASRVRNTRGAAWAVQQAQQEDQLQVAMSVLTLEQQEFRRLFADFLVGFGHLKRLNFGTGWHSINRTHRS